MLCSSPFPKTLLKPKISIKNIKTKKDKSKPFWAGDCVKEQILVCVCVYIFDKVKSYVRSLILNDVISKTFVYKLSYYLLTSLSKKKKDCLRFFIDECPL